MLAIARGRGVDRRTYDAEALQLALRRTAEATPAEVEANIHRFAAALFEGLVQLAPFGPGNDDVARHAVARFYEENGWTVDPDDLHGLLAEISQAQLSVHRAAAVLEGLARRSADR